MYRHRRYYENSAVNRLLALCNARRQEEPVVTKPERFQLFDLQALVRGIACEVSYLKKHGMRQIAIVALGALCFLTSCANQNSTAKTSSLCAGFVTANSSAIYGDPKAYENIRKADDCWFPPGRAEGQPYNRPR